ncbi:MAG: FAD-binding oxidoreductase [Candidatus Eremiobacterota bacterium]
MMTEDRWEHRWGFKDSSFVLNSDRTVSMTGKRYPICGFKMPYFLPFVEEMLGVRLEPADRRPEAARQVPPPVSNDAFLRELESALPGQSSVDERERLVHSHGQTTADEVSRVLYTRLERVADLVVHPHSTEDCVKLVELASRYDVCLVPYGGGTSVSCALKLPAEERRMIVSVDMRRMNRVEWIERNNRRASVQAGITGSQLEKALEAEGLTSGHEPDSIELSTLGGWIATNASGMKKNRYGNIEDLVESFTLVTPRGVVEQECSVPRMSPGMQLHKALFGCEGNLGLITRAVIRVHPLPEVKRYGSVVFPDFETGLDFLYDLSQNRTLPASVRLVDNVQFRFGQSLKPRPRGLTALIEALQRFVVLKVKKFDPHRMCAATFVYEGTAEEVAFQERLVARLAGRYGGLMGGSANGKRGYMLTFAIAYIRDFLADFHVVGETYETTVPWNRVRAVCEAVAKKGTELHREMGLPGQPYISPRITQVYHTGVCIYFTHGVYLKGVADPEGTFAAIEKQLRQAILDAGGSISHHHGVGKLRQEFLDRTFSPATVAALREVKQTLDPDNVFGIRNSVAAAR